MRMVEKGGKFLKRPKEVDWTRKIKDDGDLLERYFRHIRSFPLLSRAKEIELAKRIQEGDQEAEERMIQCNLRLVVSIAKNYFYQRRHLQFSDLIQEGNLGLLKAANRFDHRKGYKFSTYASWWIRQGITRAIYDREKTIRLPSHIEEKLKELKSIKASYLKEKGRLPTPKEVSQEMGIPLKTAKKILGVVKEPISLEAPIGREEDSGPRKNFIFDEKAINPEEAADQQALHEQTERALSFLKPREADIIRMRFGMGQENGYNYTLAEIGKKYSLSRERIRQIEAKALRRLRHPIQSRKLKEFTE